MNNDIECLARIRISPAAMPAATELLTQEGAAAARAADLQRVRTELTWERFAERLVAFFGETLSSPAVVSGLEGNEFSTVQASRPTRRLLYRAVRRVRRN